VARLARTISAGVALTALAGCATTQQEAARLQLNSSRIRATQVGVRVTRADQSGVTVQQVAVIRAAHSSAIVVRLANGTSRPTSDLEISVGFKTPGRRPSYLNAADGIDYFQDHIPAI
jgi:uncharacterized lipoprotein YmbA